jgi:hypothetical protein
MNSPVVLLGIIGPTQLILIIVVIALLPQIFYLLTLQNTLSKVSPSNRKMVPGQVWLSLIPLFGMVWQFIVVTRMADSLQAEFRERGITVPEEKPGYSLGIAYCVLYCCSIIPILGGLASLGGLVVWIIYWVKINEYKNLIGSRNDSQILDI